MNNVDLPQPGSENMLQSIIVRFWIGSDGALRGQLLNPVTHQVFTFASIAGLHEVLNRVVQGDLDGNEEPES